MDEQGNINIEKDTMDDVIQTVITDGPNGYKRMLTVLKIYKERTLAPHLFDSAYLDVLNAEKSISNRYIIETITKLLMNTIQLQRPTLVSTTGLEIFVNTTIPENAVIIHPSKVEEFMIRLRE